MPVINGFRLETEGLPKGFELNSIYGGCNNCNDSVMRLRTMDFEMN